MKHLNRIRQTTQAFIVKQMKSVEHSALPPSSCFTRKTLQHYLPGCFLQKSFSVPGSPGFQGLRTGVAARSLTTSTQVVCVCVCVCVCVYQRSCSQTGAAQRLQLLRHLGGQSLKVTSSILLITHPEHTHTHTHTLKTVRPLVVDHSHMIRQTTHHWMISAI